MKKIAAVVVTYNRKALLLENIESLLSQTVSDLLDIVIVDNASTDGTKEALGKYVSNENIIYKNTGATLVVQVGFNTVLDMQQKTVMNMYGLWTMTVCRLVQL